jgi:AraC family transcriptional regulator
MEIRSLARVAGLSPYHFARTFARSVGMTPHRYVVGLRLHRAIEFIREGRLCLADIAVATGFSDQAHLTRWVGRVYGVSPSRMTGKQGQRKSKLADALHASRKRSAAKWHHS